MLGIPGDLASLIFNSGQVTQKLKRAKNIE
jgi:hypothetical protein